MQINEMPRYLACVNAKGKVGSHIRRMSDTPDSEGYYTYWRDAGAWEIHVKREGAQFVCRQEWMAALGLIECTRKAWERDNNGYL